MRDWTPDELDALRARLDGYLRNMILGTFLICSGLAVGVLIDQFIQWLDTLS